MDSCLQSPYCNAYKVPNKQKGLIVQHLIVRKLTRRELEDKYLRLIDENYDLKRENNEQKEKIKILTTKLLRCSKENSKFKSKEFFLLDEDNDLREPDEYFRSRRPVSSSAIPRSTPNLVSKFKEDFFMHENSFNADEKLQRRMRENVEHSSHLNTKNSFEDLSSEKEDHVEKLMEDIRELQGIGEKARKTKSQLEIQVAELKEKLNCHEKEEQIKSSAEIEKLNIKIKELQTLVTEQQQIYQKKMNDCTREKSSLKDLLECERRRINSNESSQKMIDDLMQRVATVEEEKAVLASQSDKYAEMSNEIINCKKKISEMSQELEAKDTALEKERSDKASIEHSQEELLKKMKELQRENDQIVVKLEGLKTENEELITKNNKLESRFRILEDQNKQQLKQINETLHESSKPLEAKTFVAISQKIEETATISAVISKTEEIKLKSFYCKSPIKTDAEQELKIREPLLSSSSQLDAHKTSDDQANISTISSQDLPNISCDSPIETGAFAETFSRSVSKDHPSIDDDFDPNTFSIDQISDASECVGELIEDEQDYGFLLNSDA